MLAIRSISAEQVLAANGNLAEGFVVIRLERCSVIGDELHLDAGKRQSDVARGDDRRMLLSSNSSSFGQAVAFDDPLAAQAFDARKDCSIRCNMPNPIFLLVNRLHRTGERPGPTSVR
jgi:hypothetical protein